MSEKGRENARKKATEKWAELRIKRKAVRHLERVVAGKGVLKIVLAKFVHDRAPG